MSDPPRQPVEGERCPTCHYLVPGPRWPKDCPDPIHESDEPNKRVWMIVVCPVCDSQDVDEHHLNPDEDKADWFCEGCGADFPDPLEIKVVPDG